MPQQLPATVWDEEQVLCDSPPESLAVRLWAEVARELIGETGRASVAIDCDESDTEMKLRVAGFQLAEVEGENADPEIEESLTLEREGPLGPILEHVLRLPPEAPLGALAVAGGKGVDLDLGAGLDVWGDGALSALRRAAARLEVELV